ncbi:MAG: polyprenyl synthetase family protein [Leptospirales bacterium]
MTPPPVAIDEYLAWCKEAIDRFLSSLFESEMGKPFGTLAESMRYSLLAGGKRVRPVLAMAAIESIGKDPLPYIPLLAPLELVHTYSLIHDDLPAMDNDSLRRGKPTNHVIYGDATAILAGDALLTHAFTLLGSPDYDDLVSAEVRLKIVWELSCSSGMNGMVGGQQMDIESEGKPLDLPSLEFLHKHKTGALIRSALRIGAFLGGADMPSFKALDRYGAAVGIAFQIADDLLDVQGDAALLGKAARKDQDRNKNTYPGLMGVSGACSMAEAKLTEALEAIELFGGRATHLRELARYIIERRN